MSFSAYLKWATDSFLLATAIAQPKTSIHTHMCYCDFGDCMEAIDRLDADVNSIENGALPYSGPKGEVGISAEYGTKEHRERCVAARRLLGQSRNLCRMLVYFCQVFPCLLCLPESNAPRNELDPDSPLHFMGAR